MANLVGYGAKATDTRAASAQDRRLARDRTGRAHEQVGSTFATDGPVSRRADDREPLPPAPGGAHGGPLPGPDRPPRAVPASGAVLAKPPVRKLAKDLGIDLGTLTGSGPGGVITRDDVERGRRAGPADARPRRGSGPARRGGRPTSASRSRASARRRPRPWSGRPSPRPTSPSG